MYQIACDKRLAGHDVRRALAMAFSVPEDGVVVVNSLEEILDHSRPPVWAVHIVQNTGQFSDRLDVYFDGNLPGQPSEEQLAIYCARTFDCRCLISDEGVNPYTWLLVTPDGLITSVRVDADELDDHDGLTIVGQKHEPDG